MSGAPAITVRVGTTLAEIERQVTLATLEHLGRHKEKTAATLGISLKTLYNRLKEYSSSEDESSTAFRLRSTRAGSRADQRAARAARPSADPAGDGLQQPGQRTGVHGPAEKGVVACRQRLRLFILTGSADGGDEELAVERFTQCFRQPSARGRSQVRGRPGCGSVRRRAVGQRQRHHEAGPAARALAAGFELAAVQADDPARERQRRRRAGALVGRIGLRERVEHVGQDVGRDAVRGIAHRDLGARADSRTAIAISLGRRAKRATFASTLASAWIKRARSPLTRGAPREPEIDAVAERFGLGRARFQRAAHDTLDVEGLGEEGDLTRAGAGHFGKVGHQALEPVHLPLEDLAQSLDDRLTSSIVRSTLAAFAIGASGLRSSCASSERNSAWRRSASRRMRMRLASCSSSRLRS